MDVTLQNAAMAYGKAVSRGGDAAPEALPGAENAGTTTTSFADMLKAAGESASGAIQQAEQVGIRSNVEKVELTDVVQAVNNAEIALQTVVAVRDRVVEAYQQIIRMPI
ncbi:MAG: flagellar hook-basal body complex protein FliE [Minwuia sp.]|uniref:flagellar hook-basal body complex protein FliE n=1 Tax=Minwuia sp. TaxID=2493630 RepID=UPI003A84B0FE